MAQQYTKILRTIWQDADFLALPADSKLVYVMVITQPDINACGVLALRFNRWATLFPDRNAKQLAKAFAPLVEHNFLIVDEGTEEVMARTFMRHDGGWKQTNGLASIENAKRGVLSQQLRQVIDGIVAGINVKPIVDATLESTVDGTVDSSVIGTLRSTVDATVASRVPSRASLEPLASRLQPKSSSSSSSSNPAVPARTVSPKTQQRRAEEERNLRKSDIAKSYADELWGRANQSKIVDPLAFRRKLLETAMADPEMERVVDVDTWPAEAIGRAMATGMTHKVKDTPTREFGSQLVNGAWLAKGVLG